MKLVYRHFLQTNFHRNCIVCHVSKTKIIDKSYSVTISLHEKSPYLECFWSVFSRIWTAYGEILRTFPYSVRVRQNTDQKNSQYGHFSRSANIRRYFCIMFQVYRVLFYSGGFSAIALTTTISLLLIKSN